jgi:hypothetical protein
MPDDPYSANSMRRAITADSLRRAITEGTVNDSGLGPDELAARLADAVTIPYGDFALCVERFLVDNARLNVAAMTPEERRQLMGRVDRALRRNVPRLSTGRFSKKRCDDTAHDLVLWHVLKAMSGA